MWGCAPHRGGCTQLLNPSVRSPARPPTPPWAEAGRAPDISLYRGSRWAATPRMASASGPPAFRLETYDGGPEDGADVDKGQRGLGDVLPPMESPYVGEDRNFSPQIKVNLNYQKGAGAR